MPKKPASQQGATKSRSQSNSKPAATKARKPARQSRGRSTPILSHEEIAQRAYFLWERSGRQLGQADSHWYQAEQQLRKEQARS